MSKLVCLTFGLILLLALNSCTTWKEISISKVEEIHIKNISNSGIDAEIKVKIKNPNSMGFTIYGAAMNVSLNGNAVGTSSLLEQVYIAGNSEASHTFILNTKFDKLSAGGGGLLGLLAIAFTNSADIHLKGTISAGKFFYRKQFPIDLNQRVPLFKN